MLGRWWRQVWRGLEPWLAQLIWLDPAIAGALWSLDARPLREAAREIEVAQRELERQLQVA
jgi:hypothetical protein